MSLLFAIPDHPWVDTAEGAAVRTAIAEEPPDNGSSAVAPADPARRFLRAKPDDFTEILATLGRAHRDGEKFTA